MNDEHVPYLDGYVFYAKRSSWVRVCQAWHKGVIRFAARNLPGDGLSTDAIVAFVGEDNTPGAEGRRRAKMQQAQDAANPSFKSATSTLLTTNAPSRWSQKPPYAAHLRIKATPNNAQSVYDAFGKLFPNGGLNGHALCEGDWDVLVELGANSPHALAPLIATARSQPNIAHVDVTMCEMPTEYPKSAPERCDPWHDDPPNPG